MQTFYSNGKLLITAEYLVLFGAKALALPTQKGQNLVVNKTNTSLINWTSFNANNQVWLQSSFSILDVIQNNQKHDSYTNTLIHILHQTYIQNQTFWIEATGFEVKTHLFFDKNWGLGSSSTLLNNIANWVQVDPYKILKETFTGSGYDLACAKHNTPILYQLVNHNPVIEEIIFDPSYKNNIFFVYLNQKQSSKQAIKNLLNSVTDYTHIIEAVNLITSEIIKAKKLVDFEVAVNKHENLISSFLQQPKVKDVLFPDFKGSVKSLGAWGGDFVMVTSETNPTEYFKNKGYQTILTYNEMILKSQS
jgi:mevalonate kinase